LGETIHGHKKFTFNMVACDPSKVFIQISFFGWLSAFTGSEPRHLIGWRNHEWNLHNSDSFERTDLIASHSEKQSRFEIPLAPHLPAKVAQASKDSTTMPIGLRSLNRSTIHTVREIE
jgi:hypothetical protein